MCAYECVCMKLIWRADAKMYVELQGAGNSQQHTLEERNKMSRLALRDIMTSSKATVLKTPWDWHRNRQIDWRDETENLERVIYDCWEAEREWSVWQTQWTQVGILGANNLSPTTHHTQQINFRQNHKAFSRKRKRISWGKERFQKQKTKSINRW